MELAERCAQLRYLCISNCPHLTDQSLAALANHCPHLVTLECAGLSQLTDAGFQVPHLNRFIDRLCPLNRDQFSVTLHRIVHTPIVADPDPHHFGNPDPPPHQIKLRIRFRLRIK
jgi:hypothetical protein